MIEAAWASVQSDKILFRIRKESLDPYLLIQCTAITRLMDANADPDQQWSRSQIVGFVSSHLLVSTNVLTIRMILSENTGVHAVLMMSGCVD